LREAKSTISVMKVEAAASEREIFLLRSQLAHLQHASSDKEHDEEPVSSPAHYRDMDLGFVVPSLPTEADYMQLNEEMAIAPASLTEPLPQHYKDLTVGFSVNALPLDF
jgi:hypothetical protein